MDNFYKGRAELLQFDSFALTYKSLAQNDDIREYWERKDVDSPWVNKTKEKQMEQKLEKEKAALEKLIKKLKISEKTASVE